MEEVYHFSPSACAFFPDSLKDMYLGAGSWPQDAYLVDPQVYHKYGNPPPGSILSSRDGKPCWEEVDEPQTPEEISRAQKKRSKRLIDNVRREIDLLTYEEDIDGPCPLLSEKILSLKKYALEISRLRFEDPQKVTWPKHPLKG